MLSIQFWKSWPAVYQRIFWLVTTVFVFSVGFCLISFVENPAPVYTWQQLQELQHQDLPVYSFDAGGFDLTVVAENNILVERWLGNPIQVNLPALDIYLFLFTCALIVMLAVVTVLSRFWFFAGAGCGVFLISSFRIESLQLFGLDNKIPGIAILGLVLGACLYYQLVKTASFLHRLTVFGILSLAVGLVILNFAHVEQPFRHLATHTLPAAMVLLIVFVAMVGHEIMASFVTLVGQGTQNTKSLKHFIIISTIYLINLWLAYLSSIGYIDWGLTVPPVLLLMVAGFLAVGGIRQRQPQYEQILTADPFAVYLMLALGSLSFATVGYFYSSAMDVAMLTLDDIILYTQIGYGMMFLLYVASNFMSMLARNYPVYRVLYKPTAMPYFSFRLAGLIFTLAFIFYNRWEVPVNRFISTYYTSEGDLFVAEGNSTMATGYYKRAHFFVSYNKHTATALAELEGERGQALKARGYLLDANEYKPTEFTVTNAAQSYHIQGKTLDEIFLLRDGIKELPKSGILQNDLGLIYARLGILDSAYLLFSAARKESQTEGTAETNLLGLVARNDLNVNADSVYQLLYSAQDRVKANVLAMANRQGKLIDLPVELPSDTVLNVFTATLLGNYLTNHLMVTDTVFLTRCIKLAKKNTNPVLREVVLAPAARACYATGQVSRAFTMLEEEITAGSNPGLYNTTLALWSLDQGKPDIARIYVQFALNQKYPNAFLVNAVTLSGSGIFAEAIPAWDSLSRGKDAEARSTAAGMMRVLKAGPTDFDALSDREQWQYILYRIPLDDNQQFNRLINRLRGDDLKASAILDRSKKWFIQDDLGQSLLTWQQIQGLRITDASLFGRIKYFELQLRAAQGQWPSVEEEIKKGILFGPYHETERTYYAALSQAAAGDTLRASKNFNWLAVNNPWFDEGVVAAAAYFQHHGGSNRKVYTILSEALQVNQNSIKILKAYIPVAWERGYDEFAGSALQTLKAQVPQSAYQNYVREIQRLGVRLQ